jgi:hypothetical protein
MIVVDLTNTSWEHTYHFGKAAGWTDGQEVLLVGPQQMVEHYLYAYMTTLEQRARSAGR